MRAAVVATLLAIFCLASGPVRGRAASAPPNGQRLHPNPEIDSRLRNERARRKYDELVARATELDRAVSDLARRYSSRGRFGRDDRKTIDAIRKLAKRVRSDLGGTGDAQMTDPPSNPPDALAALEKRTSALASELAESTRFELSAGLVGLATEVLYLSDMLAQFGRR
jgi:hypothetical protein